MDSDKVAQHFEIISFMSVHAREKRTMASYGLINAFTDRLSHIVVNKKISIAIDSNFKVHVTIFSKRVDKQ